jgi:hypothetical protein
MLVKFYSDKKQVLHLSIQASRGWGSRTAPVGLPRLSTPTYRLEACVGQHGVHVFVGHHRKEFATRDNGLSRPEYPASNSG